MIRGARLSLSQRCNPSLLMEELPSPYMDTQFVKEFPVFCRNSPILVFLLSTKKRKKELIHDDDPRNPA